MNKIFRKTATIFKKGVVVMKILLQEYMNNKNLTVRQVSVLTEIPKSTISDICNSKIMPRMDTMEDLAKGLKVKITDLFDSPFK